VKVSVLRDGVETDFATPGKVTGHAIAADDVVVLESAGGGGFGDPLARDPTRVRDDVAAGLVSRERARDGYGVVLSATGDVDGTATAAQRTALAAARRTFPVVADEREAYEGRRGRHRVLRLAPTLAYALGVTTGDLVELLGRHPAPLRAWVRIDADAPDDRVPLDALGRRILGVAPGDPVRLRVLSRGAAAVSVRSSGAPRPRA
jgi:N-methylhydantoinase B